MNCNLENHQRPNNTPATAAHSQAGKDGKYSFRAFYPAVQGNWGLPDDVPQNPPTWMSAHSLHSIS
jgi:hypothetical protein